MHRIGLFLMLFFFIGCAENSDNLNKPELTGNDVLSDIRIKVIGDIDVDEALIAELASQFSISKETSFEISPEDIKAIYKKHGVTRVAQEEPDPKLRSEFLASQGFDEGEVDTQKTDFCYMNGTLFYLIGPFGIPISDVLGIWQFRPFPSNYSSFTAAIHSFDGSTSISGPINLVEESSCVDVITQVPYNFGFLGLGQYWLTNSGYLDGLTDCDCPQSWIWSFDYVTI